MEPSWKAILESLPDAVMVTDAQGAIQVWNETLEVLAGELKDELQVAKVNLDPCPELARRYGIFNVPTLILFDHGAPIASLDAWMSPLHMKAQLQGLLADYTRHGWG